MPDLAGVVAGAVLVEEGLEPPGLRLGHPDGGEVLVHNILELTHILNLSHKGRKYLKLMFLKKLTMTQQNNVPYRQTFGNCIVPVELFYIERGCNSRTEILERETKWNLHAHGCL